MIDLNNAAIFTNNKNTLKETSFDGDNKVYMSQLTLDVVNFDKVKDAYCDSLDKACSARPHSNDALFIDIEQEKFLFIEFKNGELKGQRLQDVKLKISESLLIFNDIVNENISFDRKSVNYVLVYNAENNAEFEKQRTSSLSKTASTLAKLAGRRFCINGFDAYLYFFHDVRTINQDEFKQIEAELQNGTYKF